jgi:hypothetical protein
MTDIERERTFAQQAMAVDIEIAVAAIGPKNITEEQGQAAMTAAWPYVEGAIKSERERPKVLLEALRDIRDNGYYHPDYVPIVSKALAAYGDGHE